MAATRPPTASPASTASASPHRRGLVRAIHLPDDVTCGEFLCEISGMETMHADPVWVVISE
eukprot:96008-Prymnesium_polylepis.1